MSLASNYLVFIGEYIEDMLVGFLFQSFKKFKNGFLKVMVTNKRHSHFYDVIGNPKFPFY